MKKIYIVLTQTGTLLSRVLKRLTGAKYNHVSIALDEEFNEMYSFGRINPYNPFWGGFVKESPTSGTFKRFKNTDALVLCVDIDDEKNFTIITVGCFLGAFIRFMQSKIGITVRNL